MWDIIADNSPGSARMLVSRVSDNSILLNGMVSTVGILSD